MIPRARARYRDPSTSVLGDIEETLSFPQHQLSRRDGLPESPCLVNVPKT